MVCSWLKPAGGLRTRSGRSHFPVNANRESGHSRLIWLPEVLRRVSMCLTAPAELSGEPSDTAPD
jgi:hypothetical protein